MKEIKTILSFMLIVCLLIACSNENKPIEEIIINNQITIIFENTPDTWKSEATNCMVSSEIEYIDDNFIQHKFIPDPSKQFDTLIVNTNRQVFEFRHDYKTLDKLSYLFHPGDSVIIRYQNTTPVATIINRETKKYDINFELFKREKLTPNDYLAFVKYKQPMAFADYPKSTKSMSFADFSKAMRNAEEKLYETTKEKFTLELKQEKELLDSLRQNNLISGEVAEFYQIQTLYQQKIMQLQDLFGPHSIKPLFQNLTPENFNIHLGYDKELGALNSGNILDSRNDSLMYFGYYQDITDWVYFNYLSRKVGRVKSTNYINNIATAGSNLADYLSLADTIYNSNLLSTHAKNLLLFKNIQSIIENNSIDKAKTAFEKFEETVNDSVLVNYVRDKYLLGEDSMEETNDMQLISIDMENISYNELIKKHSGKVIYIDFWGSYCKPCINQFKYANTLKELYSGKNLVQIYISAEPDIEKWEEACTKYNLKSESYFVKNRYTSKQLENMNIKYFPHYIIYSKQGELINEFAPRPSEKKLINLLDGYLAENE